MCGVVVEKDTPLHHQRMQIKVDRHEETPIGCFGVTNGIDHCCIGFLKCHMLKHAWHIDAALAQVMKVFSATPCHSNTAKQRMHHHNHGYALTAIVLIVTDKHISSSDTSRKNASNEETRE